MLKVTELYIYPIKSLGGIKLQTATITDRGPEHDRRWMLVDDNNRFISQREYAVMALLRPSISDQFLTVTYTADNTLINISLTPIKQSIIIVSVWDDHCTAQLVSDKADAWFSRILGVSTRLVFMPDETQRFTDSAYTSGNNITSFSDAYPFMMIGQASLDDLNTRLADSLPVNRFRPNIVFSGGAPYQEDTMDSFTINGIGFNGVKLCARCNVITIDQNNGLSAKEPTKTLARYRAKNNKIYFGQNLVHSGTGAISVGDEIELLTEHVEERFFV